MAAGLLLGAGTVLSDRGAEQRIEPSHDPALSLMGPEEGLDEDRQVPVGLAAEADQEGGAARRAIEDDVRLEALHADPEEAGFHGALRAWVGGLALSPRCRRATAAVSNVSPPQMRRSIYDRSA
jgi:hypothetical protein